ncbi:T9SS type A sorting domain-containing protein [Indibacter alkaliphilus]|nr:T9SS type A sorting domain-containing protein [Indibacter alkaliphilus]
MTFWTVYGILMPNHPARIYWIIAFFYGLSLNNPAFPQITLQIGDYRTTGSGDFNNPAIWETWDGVAWIPASIKPNMGNHVFIDFGHEVRLTGNEAVRSVYFNAEGSTGRKLNLQTFSLNVYGSLHLMERSGTDYSLVGSSTAITLIDWIYPITGAIVFRGNSRTVVDRASWSAQNTRSKFTVIFDPNPGQTLVVNSPFKSTRFVVRSGTLVQRRNTAGTTICCTFSFNDQVDFNGGGAFGELVVESGATFISECTGTGATLSILQRTNAIPASLFQVEEGGNAVLLGNNPVAESMNFQMEGNVYYRSNSGNQNLLRTTMAGTRQPKRYHNLIFENNAQKLLTDSLFLTGDLARLSGGNLEEAPTFLKFEGNQTQQVIGQVFDYSQVEIDKSGGRLVLDSDMRIRTNFFQRNGQVDFDGHDLHLNTDGGGVYDWDGGKWLNLNTLVYHNLPTSLHDKNATFPFEDAYQGGVRRVRLVGSSPGGDLSLRFMEIPGANWDPDFDDNDGSPILYQLNSYFEFSGLSASTDPIELRISAENLIVDDVDDLRVVSNGLAAPGIHLPGVDADTLWARRSLEFGELNGNSFTVGSFRPMSILPLNWVHVEAEWEGNRILVAWSTANENGNEKFVLHRAKSRELEFEKIAEIPSKGNSEGIQEYLFRYSEKLEEDAYFQLEQVDFDGKNSFSEVFRLEGKTWKEGTSSKVFPNPYVSGEVQFQLPSFLDPKEVEITVFGMSGERHFSLHLGSSDLEEKFSGLPKGIYLIQLEAPGFQDKLRFWRR